MYDNLAHFYDMYTGDLDREALAAFLEERFAKFGNEGLKGIASSPAERGGKTKKNSSAKNTCGAPENGSDISSSTLVIDVGCGTGKLTVLLAEKGYDMTGLDLSPEMLEIASGLGYEKGVGVLWLCQDMREMDTFGSYAAMYCLEDGVNHMTEDGDLGVFLGNARNFIDEGGLLIFDFLSDKYFSAAAGKGVFFEDGDDGTCVWTGEYDGRLMTYDIICYSPDDCGAYERYDDTVCELALEPEKVRTELEKNGFEILELFESEADPGRYYVTAKRK
ncbi:MAG: methyltransferase domain-containing protein [Clostridia bacterium]|nr:methyltransferase domain-containing protein [Clostridia bacterium]